MDRIDLRSDTVSWPTPEMRQAMANAVVGDDVFGDDPTVNRLQDEAARRLGKEAGLFVASGTMGNLVSILAHCERGDEVILGESHTFLKKQADLGGGRRPHHAARAVDGTLLLDGMRGRSRTMCITHAPGRPGEHQNTVAAFPVKAMP
jgi:threonine aldolase